MRARRFLALFALLVLLGVLPALPGGGADGPPRCSGCGKAVTGTYYKVRHEGKTLVLCPACAKKWKERQALRCGACGRKITGRYSLVKRDGKEIPLCPACAEKLKNSLPVCAVCGKQITGKYSLVQRGEEKLAVCQDCLKSGARCARCGMPVPKGHTICSRCEKEVPRCAACGEPILGKALQYDNGDRYCERCLEKLPRCAACKRPLAEGQGVEKGGRLLCRHCAETVPVCACCGKPITGKYFQHTFTEGVFCADCEANRPKCACCSRPIPGDPVMVGGTRPMCRDCFRTAVLTMDEVRAIFRECQDIIRDKIGESTYHDLPVNLVDDIAAVREEAGLPGRGNELGLFRHRGDREFEIFVLYGLSRPLAYETLAHEWAHAWFQECANALHPQWVEEGFCQWMASHVLRKKGFARGLRILENRDDLYGKGYRFLKAVDDEEGHKGVLRYVRTPPPPGKPRRKPAKAAR